MLKLFTLRERQHLTNLVRFLEANWEAMAKAGKCMCIECKEEKAKRSNEQNKLYWVLLHQIEDQAWIEGRQYSAEAWHEYARQRFIGCVDLPNGKTMGISTTTLSTKEFSEYVEKVTAWAALELGVQFVEDVSHLGRIA